MYISVFFRRKGNFMKKKIILFCDGTWQDTDSENPTNIVKLKRLLSCKCKCKDGSDIEQIALYLQGVGTRGPVDKLVGGIIGRGIEENIRDAYEVLCDNFSEGDEVHILGFSRGAYTARSLVGFIDKVGLLDRNETEKIPELWRIYKSKNDSARKGNEVIVKSLTVFDTVGSLGVPTDLSDTLNENIIFKIFSSGINEKHKFHNVKTPSNVENIFHLLAIDEDTRGFKPTLFQMGENVEKTKLKQVWFCGGHEDIGGGHMDSDTGLSNVTLHWVVGELSKLGLKFINNKEEKLKPNYKGKMHEVCIKALGQKIDLADSKEPRTIGEAAYPEQYFHKSVLERFKDKEFNYKPRNINDDLRNKLSVENLLEDELIKII